MYIYIYIYIIVIIGATYIKKSFWVSDDGDGQGR